MNKKAIESLIKCGALDSTGATRKGMLVRAAAGPGLGREGAGGRAVRPGLDLRPRRPPAELRRRRRPAHYPPLPAEEFERVELLALEKETLGIFLSSHPLAEVRHLLRERVDCSLAEVASKPGRRVGDGRRADHRRRSGSAPSPATR